MIFKSKIDAWWYLVCGLMLVTNILFLYFIFFGRYAIVNIITCLIVFVLNGLIVIPVSVNTNYRLAETSLIIRYGLWRVEIPYKNIKSINESKSLLSANALGLSMDRVEIKYYRKYNDIVLISPQNKEEFIKIIKEKIYD